MRSAFTVGIFARIAGDATFFSWEWSDMARYVLAAVIGCFYVAVSAWIVHCEGEAYRNALRRAKVATRSTSTRRAEQPRDALTGTVEATPDRSPDRAPEAPVEPTPHDRDGRAVTSTAKTLAPVELAPAPVQPPPSIGPAPESQGPMGDQTPAPVVSWANSLDLDHLKPEDESRLGKELHHLILAQVPPLETGPWSERAVKAARHVTDTPYPITILNSDAVNAFSHPGGHIYVCRGLFDLIGSDEDYALEFVLGHEIAHVDLKHALQCVRSGNAVAKQRGVDTLHQFLVPIAVGYPDAQEFEADGWIFQRMMSRLDHTRRESLAFLRKFQGYAASHHFENGRKLPDAEFPLVENHYRAHPATWDRLERLKSLLTTPVLGAPR